MNDVHARRGRIDNGNKTKVQNGGNSGFWQGYRNGQHLPACPRHRPKCTGDDLARD